MEDDRKQYSMNTYVLRDLYLTILKMFRYLG